MWLERRENTSNNFNIDQTVASFDNYHGPRQRYGQSSSSSTSSPSRSRANNNLAAAFIQYVIILELSTSCVVLGMITIQRNRDCFQIYLQSWQPRGNRLNFLNNPTSNEFLPHRTLQNKEWSQNSLEKLLKHYRNQQITRLGSLSTLSSICLS